METRRNRNRRRTRARNETRRVSLRKKKAAMQNMKVPVIENASSMVQAKFGVLGDVGSSGFFEEGNEGRVDVGWSVG